MDLSYVTSLWNHIMHRHINVHTPIFISLTYPTYWRILNDYTTENRTASPNIFVHDFINKLLLENISFKEKVIFWKKHVENPFYSCVQKRELWDIYMKTQQTYNGFRLLLRIWKLKHTSVKVNTDLYMNPIILKKGRSVSIYQNDSLYYFTIPDLINICNSSLMNSPDFFCEPYIPKNPYTNLPFSKGILYLIYDTIRHSNYRMPNLLHLFYLCNYDIDLFYYKHEAFIRDEYINNFIKTATVDDLYPYVREMLRKVVIPNKLNIDKNFPKDILSNIMRPFLKLYLIHSSSISNTEYKYRVYFELKYKLTKFQEYNPAFGRKIFVKKPQPPFSRETPKFLPSFNSDYIAFNKIIIDDNIDLFDNKYGNMSDNSSDEDSSMNERLTPINLNSAFSLIARINDIETETEIESETDSDDEICDTDSMS